MYQFTKIPFGQNGGAASSQRVIGKVLQGVQDCAATYIDEILVFSCSWEAHLTHLQQVLEALRQTRLTANLKKILLGHMTMQYLGFCIGQRNIWVVSNKVAALREVPLPHTKMDLQRFLGLAYYYKHFVLGMHRPREIRPKTCLIPHSTPVQGTRGGQNIPHPLLCHL